MPRKVFFSFHYDRDIWRVSQVRNSWVTQGTANTHAGWLDHAEWETVKRGGDTAIKRWIDNNLQGSSVTVVCIGQQTALRPWVQYEIQRSHEKGNGIIGITIHNLADRSGRTDSYGPNPFDKVNISGASLLLPTKKLSSIIPIYDWKLNNGYANLGNWVEQAARKAGR
jgi:hypothetical protein